MKAHAKGEHTKYDVPGPQDVFETRIKKTATCWIWTGTKHQYGYGILLLPGEVPVRAHRYSYEFFTGRKIPKGKIVMHICDNPTCVNPAHLKIGTKLDNNRDRILKRRGKYNEDRANYKITAAQVRKILKDNRSQSAIARAYGVHQSHISRIIHRQARKYV